MVSSATSAVVYQPSNENIVQFDYTLRSARDASTFLLARYQEMIAQKSTKFSIEALFHSTSDTLVHKAILFYDNGSAKLEIKGLSVSFVLRLIREFEDAKVVINNVIDLDVSSAALDSNALHFPLYLVEYASVALLAKYTEQITHGNTNFSIKIVCAKASDTLEHTVTFVYDKGITRLESRGLEDSDRKDLKIACEEIGLKINSTIALEAFERPRVEFLGVRL